MVQEGNFTFVLFMYKYTSLALLYEVNKNS